MSKPFRLYIYITYFLILNSQYFFAPIFQPDFPANGKRPKVVCFKRNETTRMRPGAQLWEVLHIRVPYIKFFQHGKFTL